MRLNILHHLSSLSSPEPTETIEKVVCSNPKPDQNEQYVMEKLNLTKQKKF